MRKCIRLSLNTLIYNVVGQKINTWAMLLFLFLVDECKMISRKFVYEIEVGKKKEIGRLGLYWADAWAGP